MKIEQYLNKLKILPVRELNNNETQAIIQSIIEVLPNLKIEKDENIKKAILKLEKAPIYFSVIENDEIGKVCYLYKNNTIYLDISSENYCLTKPILHEVIHYIQDNRNKKGKLKNIGFCEFSKFRLNGLALNETAAEYIISKLMNDKNKKITMYGITFEIIDTEYYPILTSLINQLAYTIGEETIAKGVFYDAEEFKYYILDNWGESAYNTILENFDKILDRFNKINRLKTKSEEKNIKKIQAIRNQIKEIYVETQNIILTSYFDNIYGLLETIEEVEQIKEKLLNYINVIGHVNNDEFFNSYSDKMMEKLEKKISYINHKNNALTIIKTSKIFKIFKMLQSARTK